MAPFVGRRRPRGADDGRAAAHSCPAPIRLRYGPSAHPFPAPVTVPTDDLIAQRPAAGRSTGPVPGVRPPRPAQAAGAAPAAVGPPSVPRVSGRGLRLRPVPPAGPGGAHPDEPQRSAPPPAQPSAVRPSSPSSPPSCATPPPVGHDAEWLGLIRRIGACDDFQSAAATVCTDIAAALGAARVVLGWRRHGHAPARPLAMSGAHRPEWDSETVRRLSAVLDEAIDQSVSLACPGAPDARALLRAHDAMRRAHGVGAVMTAPIAHEGIALGALTAEFDTPPPPAALERLTTAAGWVAPWLRLLDARRPGPLARAAASFGLGRRGRRDAIGARSGPRLLAAVVAVAALALSVPVDLSVSAPARIEGEQQRSVAAPLRGYLKSVSVRPGDTVREGDVLAELGDRDLELERSKLRSELGQHAAAVNAAMARGDRPGMAVAQSKRDEVGARLALIEHQLEQIRVRAPIDGVVIQGDLLQRIGAPLDRGQELFVVAPDARYRVIVELDERDIRRVAIGQPGRLALSALPWDALPVRVDRLSPAAIALDGRNVFELEASLPDTAAALRPGQRGVVHLEAGRGPLALDWGRRLSDALARLAWRWMP